ncbi:MAG: YraN family protein, partial [Candidatus Pacebacteria bacterium]|nr:YraN family protein [Candidatus Paceibacterota bacterium]
MSLIFKGRPKAVDLSGYSRKEIGSLGERIAANYVERHGMRVVDRNVARKTGEIDVIAVEGETLHFIEVKTICTDNFPKVEGGGDEYDPAVNLHESKVRKVARTGEWYVLEKKWGGEWQV